MAEDCPIPSVQLDATLVGRRSCFDAWREAVRPFFDVEPLSETADGKESAKAWLVNDLIFTEVAFSPQSFRHYLKSSDDPAYLSLQIYTGGSCRGIVGDIPFELVPGEVQIFDFSREFCSLAEESSVVGAVVPHDAIGYDPERHPAHMRFPGTSSAGRFLMDTFFALKNQLPILKQNEAGIVAGGFRGLLRGLLIPELSETPETTSPSAERRLEMRSYLDNHLTDPNLGIEDLCSAFGVSKPSIYRDFADTGGVAQYITNRRLDRAFHQLLRSPPGRGAVQETASRWGFDDPGHFSKTFRRRFGVPPSVALNVGREESTHFTSRIPDGGQSIDFSSMGAWLTGVRGRS